MNIRMLGTSKPQFQSLIVKGRQYSAAEGAAVDVPDFDAGQLQANGWVHVAPSGPTSARPAGALGLYPAIAGVQFLDTTIGALIVFDGAVWRNPVSGAAV